MKKAKSEAEVTKDDFPRVNKSLNKQEVQKEKNSQIMTLKRAEDLFGISQGEKMTKDDLKKRYRDLLKMNHPDKVASLSPEFKDLAHKKTKEINDAYELLMSKIS